MKILVTGGAGFIGSHLTDRLLAENNQVVALDNLSLGRKSNLKQASENPNFTFIEEDILHEDALNRIGLTWFSIWPPTRILPVVLPIPTSISI